MGHREGEQLLQRPHSTVSYLSWCGGGPAIPSGQHGRLCQVPLSGALAWGTCDSHYHLNPAREEGKGLETTSCDRRDLWGQPPPSPPAESSASWVCPQTGRCISETHTRVDQGTMRPKKDRPSLQAQPRCMGMFGNSAYQLGREGALFWGSQGDKGGSKADPAWSPGCQSPWPWPWPWRAHHPALLAVWDSVSHGRSGPADWQKPWLWAGWRDVRAAVWDWKIYESP